jgi:hypothetical protein
MQQGNDWQNDAEQRELANKLRMCFSLLPINSLLQDFQGIWTVFQNVPDPNQLAQLAKACVTVTGALLSFLPGPIAIESSSMDWYTSLTMVLSAQWIFECSDHFRYTSGTKVPEPSPANSWKANLRDYVPASIWMHRTSQNYRVLANFCEQQGTSREQR